MSLNIKILSEAADQARGLCMDAVEASKSGHLGLPLGCAEMGAVLYGYALKYNPDKPRWINRDIFVLSAGHGSMFLYAWLHMSGYDLPWGEIMATGTLIVLPVIVFALIVSKHLVQGLTMGAVK